MTSPQTAQSKGQPISLSLTLGFLPIAQALLSAKQCLTFDRCKLVSRFLAGIFGAYAFAAAACSFLAVALPMPKAQSTLTAMMLSFLLYAVAAIWVFSVRETRTAWIGLLSNTFLLLSLTYILGR
jgi:hypothetical protein